MNRRSFLTGFLSGAALVVVLVMIYSGVQALLDFTQDQGLGVVTVEYESLDAKFQDILEKLDENYYEEIDTEELYTAALGGFVDGLGDPYTVYYTAEQYASFTEGIDGTYEGIGAYIGYGDTRDILLVMRPMDGSPAEQAGLEPLDRFVEVDGVEVSGLTTDELVKLIKGPKGTEVEITVSRDGELVTVTVIRETIIVPTVDHELLEDNIGYISIAGFDRVTYDQFLEAYDELESQNQEGLIIDLRYNPGGLTNIVSAITDVLLPKDLTIYYTEDKDGDQIVIETQDREEFTKPLVILVNEGSASASEILAGAVKDHDRGEIVGTTTFGKGLVQSSMFLEDGSALKVTIAKYFTPDGFYIHGTGIEPDVVSEIPEVEDPDSLPEDWDPQLEDAIEVIQGLMGN